MGRRKVARPYLGRLDLHFLVEGDRREEVEVGRLAVGRNLPFDGEFVNEVRIPS